MAEVIQVEARRRGNAPAPDVQRDMQNVQRLAELLDTEFSLGGIRFGLDALIGLVPFIGDLFDVGFKANIRNANLLRRAFEQRGNLRPKE